VLHVAGAAHMVGLDDAVSVVGARRATQYGLTVAHDLGRGLASAAVSVVSGLALGVDSAAHTGALAGTGVPVAVLAGGADRPYPASKRTLYLAVRTRGAVVSELPPGFGIHRWAFVARNRLIAALSRVTVVVEATERSGSLTTADLAAELGRTVAAVPGRVTCSTATGVNGLLRDGAVLVRNVRDVLDELADLTGTSYATRAPGGGVDLDPGVRQVLEAIGDGHSTLPMLVAAGFDARSALAGLGELEGRGLVRRGFGGRYERVPL
jgi:DNA processing protein